MRNGIMKAFYYTLVTVMGLVVLAVVTVTRMVSASALSGIENKMLIASAASCINYGNAIAGTLNLTQKLTEREAIPGLINPAASAEAPLPSFVYSSDKISCQNLLRGGGEIQRGMFDAAGINAMAVSEQLNLFGFKQKSSGTQETVSRKIEFNGGGVTTYSNEINVTAGSTGIKVSMGGTSTTTACEGKSAQQNIATVSMSGGNQFAIRFNNSFCVVPDGVDSSGIGWLFRLSSSAPDYIRNGITFSYSLQNGTVDGFFDALTERLSQASANILYESTYTPGGGTHDANNPLKATFSPSIEPVDAVEPASTEWKREIGNSAAAKKFLEKAGYGSGDSVAFNSSEVLAYYVDKLKNHYFSGASASNYWICDAGISASGRYVPIKMTASGGSPQTEDECKIDTSMATASDKMNGFSAPYGEDKSVSFDSIVQSHISYRQLDLTGLIEAINELLDFTPPPEVPTADNNNGNNNNNGGKDDPCYNAGLKSTAWIICPALSNMIQGASLAETMADQLMVPSKLYEPGSALEAAWSTIRNIANVAIAVILVVVIFSQLTGYGIDNYGVKKILPRLVVMSIVINLSFYICVLLVDFSNILGEGLMNVFKAAGVSVYQPGIADGVITTAASVLFGAAGVAGGTAGVVAPFAGLLAGATVGVVVVVLLVVMVIVVLAAILMFLVTVGIRNILLLGCIVLAPLAIVFYILPNTQNMYKKWWGLFRSALIIYPICGLLIGVSYMLKSIVLGSQGLHPILYVILVVAPYAVYFLIPSLVKASVAALGQIGSALMALGTSGRANMTKVANLGKSAAMRSERAKNFQAENARRAQYRGAENTERRLNRIKQRQGYLEPDQIRQLARAQEVQRKMRNEDAAARAILTENEFQNKSEADMQKAWVSAWDAGDTDRMNALTDVMVSRNASSAAKFFSNRFANMDIFERSGPGEGQFVGGNNGAMAKSFEAFRSNLGQNQKLANAMNGKAKDVFNMFSSGGYVKENIGGVETSVRRNVVDTIAGHNSHVASLSGVATEVDDWASASSDTLKRAINNGGLSAEMANKILTSKNQKLQSGLLSDSGKVKILQAAAGGYSGNFDEADKRNITAAQHRYNSGNSISLQEATRQVDVGRSMGLNEAQLNDSNVLREAVARYDSGYSGKTADAVQGEAMRENAGRALGLNASQLGNKQELDAAVKKYNVGKAQGLTDAQMRDPSMMQAAMSRYASGVSQQRPIDSSGRIDSRIHEEANRENAIRTQVAGGMKEKWARRSADDVYEKAWRENAKKSGQGNP